MKILVIGGTGAFGARLCDLLDRDGHTVTIASRTKPATVKPSDVTKDRLDFSRFDHMVFDRNGPLDGFDAFDVIVDAAGPFHAYGDDPYRVAKAAIAAKAHYFDLCDNADFCAGISVLNDDAKAAGVAVYSGMSSVPAVSSSVVSALAAGQTIDAIETAILPGNKAPRGRAVVESILHQTGKHYVTTQAGAPVNVRSWSDPKTYQLGQGIARQGWRIEVPDQRLFPAHFDCPNVAFRAGLELGVLRYALGFFSVIRRIFGFSVAGWFVSFVMLGANVLRGFGTDVGGMVVDVVCRDGAHLIRRRWTLLAKQGDGPYVPGIAVRAACRDLSALKTGAGPALSAVPLASIAQALSDLDISTTLSEVAQTSLFQPVLGESFDNLPAEVRATHHSVTARKFIGRASVKRGTGILARIAALLFGFPPSTDDVEVEVTKYTTPTGETWHRRFGHRKFRSHLRQTPRGMSERFGPLTFDLALEVRGKALHFPVKSGRCLGVPIPRPLLPQSIATETQKDSRFQFDVHLKAPTGATLVHYRGWLEPNKAESEG